MKNKVPQVMIDMAKDYVQRPLVFCTKEEVENEILNLENEVKMIQDTIDERKKYLNDIEEGISEVSEWLKSIGENELAKT